jgi:hypothetical protein
VLEARYQEVAMKTKTAEKKMERISVMEKVLGTKLGMGTFKG